MTNPKDIEALKCADCARSESAVTDLDPSAVMPIPAEALVGWPAGHPEDRGFSRRSLLKHGVAGLASVYAATRLDWGSVWEEVAAQAAEPMQRSVVCVFLNGGQDGANVVIPIDTAANMYPRYRNEARATLYRDHVTGQDVTPSVPGRVGTTRLPGSGNTVAWANVGVAGAGNNGGIGGFDTLYGDGSGGPGSDLAVFTAAGYPNATRSHFDGRDIWFRGTTQMTQTGWLGRWLDLYGSQLNPLQAVSIDSNLSKQIRTSKAPVSALENLGGISFSVDNNGADVTQDVKSLAGVPFGAGNAALERARSVYGLTVSVSDSLKALTAQSANPALGYPQSDLSRKLQLAATLLSAGLGTRIVTIDWGSFDTHGGQLQSHDAQLQVLSRALASFKADLQARGIEQQVTTLVFSEFGRQIYQNDSDGTDHGDAGLMLVSGSAVRGGFCGEFPGIPQSSEYDSIKIKDDFRTVYQAIVAEWLGGDPAAVLPGAPFGAIDRYDNTSTALFKV